MKIVDNFELGPAVHGTVPPLSPLLAIFVCVTKLISTYFTADSRFLPSGSSRLCEGLGSAARIPILPESSPCV